MEFLILVYIGLALLFGAWAFDAYSQGDNEYRHRAYWAGGQWKLAIVAGSLWPGVVYYYLKNKVKSWQS